MVGIALGVLAGLFSSSAWAQTRLTEAAEGPGWLFTPGTLELGAQIGGGFSLAESTREATEFALLPRIGYVFAQQEYFLPGSVELVAEPTFLTVFQHQTVYVGGLAALLKYNFRTGTRWTPYLVGGAGLSFASHRLPHGGPISTSFRKAASASSTHSPRARSWGSNGASSTSPTQTSPRPTPAST